MADDAEGQGGTATATAPPPDATPSPAPTDAAQPASDTGTPPWQQPHAPMAQTPDQQTATMPQAQTEGTPPPPRILTPEHQGMRGVLDRVLDAIAGPDQPKVYTDQDGNKMLLHPPSTGAQKWMRVAATELQGAGAGLANGQGPGGMERAAAAGIQSGFGIAQQRDAQGKATQEEIRQNKLDQANNILIQQRIATGTFDAARRQTVADQEDIKFADEQRDRIKAEGGRYVGTYTGDNLHTVAGVVPDFWAKQHKGEMQQVPAISQGNGQGNFRHVGNDLYLMAPNFADKIAPEGSKWQILVPSKNADEPSTVQEVTPTTPFTVQQDLNNRAEIQGKIRAEKEAITKQQQGQATLEGTQTETQGKKLANKKAELEQPFIVAKEQADIAEKKGAAAASLANARKSNFELDQQKIGDDVDSQAQALVDKRSAVSLMSKRSKDFNAILSRADQLSMQQLGHPYDRAQGEIEYEARKGLIKSLTEGKDADTIQSFDAFLGHAYKASQLVQNMRANPYEASLLNKSANALAKMTGDKRAPDITEFLQEHNAAKQEVGNILKSGAALHAPDIDDLNRVMDDSLGPAALQGAYKGAVEVTATKLRGLDFKASRTLGGHVPNLISFDGQEALRHFKIDPKSVYSSDVQLQQAHQATNPGPIAPHGAAFHTQTPDANGKLWWVGPDKKTVISEYRP